MKNSMRHGFGILKMPDETIYRGMWNNDKKYGKVNIQLMNGSQKI